MAVATATTYTQYELLVKVAASLLEDGRAAIIGTGLPMLAGLFAQRTHAPNLLLIFEAGGFGPQVPVLPISVGDSRTFHRAILAGSMHDVMSCGQAGYIDYGFLGAAQIDTYGNLNTTVIGDHANPKVRLPGSGGASDIGSYAWRTILIMSQDPSRFVEQLDFLTTPGYLDGPGARERAGLPSGSGPYRVITQLGLFDFEEETKRMRLIAVHPGVTVEAVQAASGFELLIADDLKTTEPPAAVEQGIMHQLDPRGMILGR